MERGSQKEEHPRAASVCSRSLRREGQLSGECRVNVPWCQARAPPASVSRQLRLSVAAAGLPVPGSFENRAMSTPLPQSGLRRSKCHSVSRCGRPLTLEAVPACHTAIGPVARLCVLGPQPLRHAVHPPGPHPAPALRDGPAASPCQVARPVGSRVTPCCRGPEPAGNQVQACPTVGGCPLLRAPSLGSKGGEGQVNPAVCPSSLERRKRERSGSDVPVSKGARPASSSRSVSQAPQASFLGTHKRALENGSDGGPSCLPSAQLLAGRDKALLFEGRHQFRFFLCHCSPVVPVTFSRLEALPS